MEASVRQSPKMKPGLSPISKPKPGPSPAGATAKPGSTSQGAQAQPIVKKEAPADLPVLEAKNKIVKMVLANSVVVLVGETGSGKTTQIPQFLLDEVLPKMSSVKGAKGAVAVTQPRRVAAISVASYVSELRGCRIGEEVGYVVRFDDKTSQRTKLKYMTDGILLKELLANPALPQYSVIMLDEAHERTLHGDVLFGLLKRLHQMRPHDLKIIIMSATLNTSKFSAFWNNAPIGYVTGRAFPVTVFHTTEPQADYLDAAVNTIMQIHTEEPPGDILCFLTGQDEIEDCRELLNTRRGFLPATDKGIWIVPLYAAMAPEQQQQAFQKAKNGERKIILATNIAETSITIEGIVYVVDCGLLKAKQFNANTGMELLLEVPVSKAQARQRTGRAGRLQAGRCYRLYTEPTFESLEENPIPEILRCSLDSVVLQMKAMNIDNLLEFEFMDKPSPGAVLKAMHQLYYLGALDGDLKITPLGRILADFPVDPMAAKTLVRAAELDVADDVCGIIAMLSTENVRLHSSGDHITALKLFQGYMAQLSKAGSHHQMREWCEENRINERQIRRVKDAFAQLKALLEGESPGRSSHAAEDTGTSRKRGRENGEKDPNAYFAKEDGNLSDFANVRRAFCAGYFLHAAYFHAKRLGYITCVAQLPVEAHPSSGFAAMKGKKPALILYNSVVRTTKQYMRDILVVREDWLYEEAPLVFKKPAN